jgi:transcription elongation GreA/GreB family factor
MDKEQIVQAVLERLRVDFETHQSTSKMTRSAGNDAETKSEGKYDTRSTEENYLADGLAKKALVAAQAAREFKELAFEEFGSTQPIDLGALVQLSFDDEHAWFFLGPAAGGIEIEHAGELITVITTASPLGNQILGKKVGDLISAPKAKIESVQ